VSFPPPRRFFTRLACALPSGVLLLGATFVHPLMLVPGPKFRYLVAKPKCEPFCIDVGSPFRLRSPPFPPRPSFFASAPPLKSSSPTGLKASHLYLASFSLLLFLDPLCADAAFASFKTDASKSRIPLRPPPSFSLRLTRPFQSPPNYREMSDLWVSTADGFYTGGFNFLCFLFGRGFSHIQFP